MENPKHPGVQETESKQELPTLVNSSVEDARTVQNGDPPGGSPPSHDTFLHGRQLVLVHGGLLMTTFLVALDQSIVSTALPRIASEFNQLDQISWVVSAYFLTQAGLLLFFGRVLRIVSTKSTFLLCICIFEAGSLICALAPSMNVLIFGRAFQASLKTRPALLGTFAAVFGIAGIAGPILGVLIYLPSLPHFTEIAYRGSLLTMPPGAGASMWAARSHFRSDLTSFQINLPLGAMSFVVIVWLLPNRPPLRSSNEKGRKSLLQGWLSLDWVGAVLALGMVTTLIIPLQSGGVTKPWNDPSVIALFVVSGVLFLIFGAWENHLGDEALLPLYMLFNRTQLAAGLAIFFIFGTHLVNIYHLPFLFQAKGRSPSQGGVDIFPYVLGLVFASIVTGILVRHTGRYWPFLLSGPAIGAVGSGLMFTATSQTESAKLIGYQILMGFGVGNVFQIPIIAVQAEYAHRPDFIPQASALQLFFQLLGGVCGISITGAIFGNQLSRELATYPQIPPGVIDAVTKSVTVIFTLPQDLQGPIIDAYISALDWTFLFGVPAMALGLFFGCFVRNWHLHRRGDVVVEGRDGNAA